MKRPKAKTVKAFAVARDNAILLDRIEPFTEEGRADLVRSINRPAGESVKVIGITVMDQPR